MNIPELIKECYEIACDNRFYDCPNCIGVKDEEPLVMALLRNNCPVCHETGIDPDKNIGSLLMGIVSELGEAYNAHRVGKFANWELYERDLLDHTCLDKSEYQKQKAFMASFMDHIKHTYGDEIADTYIRLFALCGYLGIEPSFRNTVTIENMPENIGQTFLYVSWILGEGFLKAQNTEYHFSMILTYLIYFCDHNNIPIEKHIAAKNAYNRTMDPRNGKEY